MKRFICIQVVLILLIGTYNVKSQSEDRDITLTVRGSGQTLEDSKQNAFRSAIQQAFGAFISSKTEMLNDRIIADQMASVSSGNIKRYDVLEEFQIDNNWITLIKVTVSIDNLTSFVENKGMSVEVKDGLFAMNIKQQKLNEEWEFY